MNYEYPAERLVELVEQAPVSITRSDGIIIVDFGRVAFGNIRLELPPTSLARIIVHFGESAKEGRIDRAPNGSVRYAEVALTVPPAPATRFQVVTPPPDAKNTGPAAVHLPIWWGVVLPFRWIEIEGWPEDAPFTFGHIVRRAAFARDWDDSAAAFACSDEDLTAIWDLCHYSIKATTFAGVYVDGDRERIPYEADAYLNQLSHYACDSHSAIARETFDHLVTAPTWPTEWAFHMVFIAHAEWIQSGDVAWLAARYEALKPKLLLDRARPDGLISSTLQHRKYDIVDWPPGERDEFEFSEANTVVNAFHYRAIVLMADLAAVVGALEDATLYRSRAASFLPLFHQAFFDSDRGIYRDGESVGHASQHANLFALAFGLVPEADRASVVAYIVDRGMACSVYAAQYLLQCLFENGEERAALALITAPGDRSWAHMLKSGTTITWEAWDQRYKPNQDWNHAWGAAPVNILSRFVAGVFPTVPGWGAVTIEPRTGNLEWCHARVPTPRGPIDVSWRKASDFRLDCTIPPGIEITVSIQAAVNARVALNGAIVSGRRLDNRVLLEKIGSGGHVTVEVLDA